MFDSLGAAYRQCENGLKKMADELTQALKVDMEDRVEGNTHLEKMVAKYVGIDCGVTTNDLRVFAMNYRQDKPERTEMEMEVMNIRQELKLNGDIHEMEINNIKEEMKEMKGLYETELNKLRRELQELKLQMNKIVKED